MVLDIKTKKIPKTVCKIYCAEILGLHETYRFDRYFLPEESDDALFLDDPDESTVKASFDMLEEGIYEMSIKYVDSATEAMLWRNRIWICLYGGDFFFIYTPKNVMAALEGFKALDEADRNGADISETIDSFFDRLAKNNALDGGLPPWFRYNAVIDKLFYTA